MAQRAAHDEAIRFLNEWYPCTTLLLGDRIEPAVERFCDEASANAAVDPATEAHRWLMFLRSEISREGGLPPYTEAVAQYEATIAALATSEDAKHDALLIAEQNGRLPEPGSIARHHLIPAVGRNVRIESYAFDTPGIVAAIEDCDRLEPVEQPTPCTVLFVRTTGQPRPRPLLISEGVQMLLTLCDGRRNCADVLRCLQSKTGTEGGEDFERRALEALETLSSKNVVTFREPQNDGGSDR